MRKTKIVCTLGPASENEKVLAQMIKAGMNVARLNFSHGSHEEQLKRINLVKKLRRDLNTPIAIMLDTKGPEIRLGKFEDGKAVLSANETITLTTKDVLGNQKLASVSYQGIVDDVHRGSTIMLDDGLIELSVLDIVEDKIICKIVNGGNISDHKSVNLPGSKLTIPFLSEHDKEDLRFGIKNEVDFIAASFTRRGDDLREIRAFVDSCGGEHIGIIAKIENAEGVSNINEIIHLSDGIMVARGDLGVEIPFEELPRLQKEFIKKAYRAGKRVITATQMLESMIVNPRPTRAEISDVANAIYDGTSAIMLSGETSIGMHPIEVVKTMASIAEKTEQDINYVKRFETESLIHQSTATNAISHATCTTAIDLGAAAILTVTKSGETARMISKYRPISPIIACTPNRKTYYQLALSWGVEPIMIEEVTSTDELFELATSTAVKEGYLENGDLVVITAGIPLGVSGTTNLLKIHLVGKVLVMGSGINAGIVCGNLCVCKSEEEIKKYFKSGDILVVSSTNNNMVPYIKKAKGIICEEDGPTSHAAVVGLTLGLPVIVGARNATTILKNGIAVTMDSHKGIVY